MEEEEEQRVTIYVLELEHGKYYVGKTRDVDTRVREHLVGQGSAWTSLHPPVDEIRRIPNCTGFDEDKYTKIYMHRYGIDNVRGGSYCQVDLDPVQKALLKREIRGATDRCLRCGHESHFAADCFAQTDVDGETIAAPPQSSPDDGGCFRCGRQGHWAYQCYASTDAEGDRLMTSAGAGGRPTSTPTSPKGRPLRKEEDECHRCGRLGHWAAECNVRLGVSSPPARASPPRGGRASPSRSSPTARSDDAVAVVCDRCGRSGHRTAACYAQTDVNGRRLK